MIYFWITATTKNSTQREKKSEKKKNLLTNILFV